jgi:hypothetical protein
MSRSSCTRRVRRAPFALAAGLALLGLLGLAGCRHVAPYEREHLARRCMDTSQCERLRARFQAHVYDAREGAMGTTDSAGGGCGCN